MLKVTVAGLVVLLALSAAADAHTLSHAGAKRAGQKRADRIAHKRTRVFVVQRITRHRYQVMAKWTRVNPTGCKDCGYDEQTGAFYDTATTEYCSVDMRVLFRSPRSHRLRVRVVSTSCF